MTRTPLAARLALCAGAALALTGMSAAPAASAEWTEVRRTVHLADLDLNTPAGAKRAAFRIRIAAKEACGAGNWLMRIQPDFLRCRDEAVARAVSELNAPLVTAAFGGRPSMTLARR